MNIQDIQSHYGVHLLTSEIPRNMEVVSCFGMVHGQAILGANFVKDFFARVADTTGGRVTGYEKALNGATLDALDAMAKRAFNLGANAVVAVDVRTSGMGPRMLMASCTGTAYILRERTFDEREPRLAAEKPHYLHPEPLG